MCCDGTTVRRRSADGATAYISPSHHPTALARSLVYRPGPTLLLTAYRPTPPKLLMLLLLLPEPP